MFSIEKFWNDVINQNQEKLISYFAEDALIQWPCTNEQFSVQEYIKVNCDYPGNWSGNIELIEKTNSQIILAGQVFSKNKNYLFMLLVL